jgi:hypothetical protein
MDLVTKKSYSIQHIQFQIKTDKEYEQGSSPHQNQPNEHKCC